MLAYVLACVEISIVVVISLYLVRSYAQVRTPTWIKLIVSMSWMLGMTTIVMIPFDIYSKPLFLTIF